MPKHIRCIPINKHSSHSTSQAECLSAVYGPAFDALGNLHVHVASSRYMKIWLMLVEIRKLFLLTYM